MPESTTRNSLDAYTPAEVARLAQNTGKNKASLSITRTLVLAIIFPVSAFVALGFEHSIANMYFIPLGYFLGSDMITITGLLNNLVPVTLGNIFGGSILVALVYWISFLKNEPQ